MVLSRATCLVSGAASISASTWVFQLLVWCFSLHPSLSRSHYVFFGIRWWLDITGSRSSGLVLSQCWYALFLAGSINRLLYLHYGAASTDATSYRQVDDNLQYLLVTSPDIAFAINCLSQLFHSPSEYHWVLSSSYFATLMGLDYVYIFIQTTPSHFMVLVMLIAAAILMINAPPWPMSTMAYVIFIRPYLISWSSKKQKSIARTSMEAKCRAIASGASWICTLLHELGISLPSVSHP